MNRKFLIYLAVIIILALVIVVWGLVLPSFDSFSNAQRNLKAEEGRLQELKELKDKLTNLSGRYSAREEELKKVSSALPSGNDILSLLVTLEALSYQNGLMLKNMDFLPEEEKSKKTPAVSDQSSLAGSAQLSVKKLGVDLTLQGDYKSFKSFLKAAENSLRIMDVNTISFSASKEGLGESNRVFDYTVNLAVYYR